MTRLGKLILTTVCVGVVGLMFLPSLFVSLDHTVLSEGDTAYFNGAPQQASVTGEVVSIEEGFVTLKDKEGALHKFPRSVIAEKK
jgi:hypothetical protein